MGRKITVLALALCWFGVAQSPPVSRDAGKLQLHQPIERDLAPSLTDVFTLEASAGQFIYILVEKKGVDVVLTVADPDGKTLLTADSPNYTSGLEPASWIASTTGVYSVRVAKSA